MTTQPKRRRSRGSGCVYQKHKPGCSRPEPPKHCACPWWIGYKGLDGRRHAESAETARKGDAERLLRDRIGKVEHGVPITPEIGKLTFADAVKALKDDYRQQRRRTLDDVERRITSHLLPFFGVARRMVTITTPDVRQFIARRLETGIVRGSERVRDVKHADVNRDLTVLKRMFSIAVRDGQLLHRPHIPMLAESAPRSGFFEAPQVAAVLRHLPAYLRPVVEFAYITGWRTKSEILPLEWRQVDFAAGEIRLEPGTTKNGEGRTFVMTTRLRMLLEERQAERDTLKDQGIITPLVFFHATRKSTDRKGPATVRSIHSFKRAWKTACAAAGVPGRIPHDLRRTAIRNMVRHGIPEAVAMKMAGHKTRSVFDRYNIVSGGDLKDAARKLDAGPLPHSRRGKG